MRNDLPAGQAGIILPIALIVLVAMTLSALSLIRSVNMTTLMAGNLAFRESALLSAERSTETVLRWLVENSENGKLNADDPAHGYLAKRDPADVEGSPNWDAYWNTTLKAHARELGEDAAGTGNHVSYVIHRMCDSRGAPTYNGCSRAPISNSGNSRSGSSEWPDSVQIYYRITTQVKGPRYTVVYTQTTIAI